MTLSSEACSAVRNAKQFLCEYSFSTGLNAVPRPEVWFCVVLRQMSWAAPFLTEGRVTASLTVFFLGEISSYV